MSQRRGATDEQVAILRKWRDTPKEKRPRTIVGMAAMLGISEYVAKRAAYGMRAYADTQRVSRGLATPGRVMTDRGVRRPVAISVASSAGTPGITGVAGGAETRHHERAAETRGVAGNAGAAGGGHP